MRQPRATRAVGRVRSTSEAPAAAGKGAGYLPPPPAASKKAA
jgi:hypothetical protein